ncbi:hypothetical protein PS273GM_00980 [Stutzerimonas stutzeri]|uniref:Uncharacterized protein n=1 Tax=Stutzerimonas stutzeri TaxID=316 RepID=A0A172WKK4_STUST|nr:hypothetical protein PS273GM_00980 [Stutzerimonas stutzeri]
MADRWNSGPRTDSACSRAGNSSPIQHDHLIEQRVGGVYRHLQPRVVEVEAVRPAELLQQIPDDVDA